MKEQGILQVVLNLDNTIIPQTDIPNHTYNIVVATTDVNVRKKDDINSERLTLLLKGESLPLLADMENGWYKVKYYGEEAYLRREFVYESIKTELANNYYKVICLKTDSNLITPEEKIELPKYECGKVYNETEDSYLIESDNIIGYISKENLLALNDSLPEKYRDHELSDNWKGFRECHIFPDWIFWNVAAQ